MTDRSTGHGLEFLLVFDGRVHHLEDGYWLKFEIRRVRPDRRRPHGLLRRALSAYCIQFA